MHCSSHCILFVVTFVEQILYKNWIKNKNICFNEHDVFVFLDRFSFISIHRSLYGTCRPKKILFPVTWKIHHTAKLNFFDLKYFFQTKLGALTWFHLTIHTPVIIINTSNHATKDIAPYKSYIINCNDENIIY